MKAAAIERCCPCCNADLASNGNFTVEVESVVYSYPSLRCPVCHLVCYYKTDDPHCGSVTDLGEDAT